MKVVILAAGRGTRMNELTNTLPKPMLTHEGKNLLEYKLDILADNTSEIILVIGYLGNKIQEYFGDSYNNIPIRYITQTEMNGTAGALWICRDFLDGPFMVLMADDIYDKNDLDSLSKTPDDQWSILTYQDKPGTCASKIVTGEHDQFVQIYPDYDGNSPYTLLYTGACVLTPKVFTKPMFQISDTEFGLPQSFAQFAQEQKITVFKTDKWLRITAQEDLR